MSKHYAIKCTNCAAPLDILGGGRINTVTCSYCHSILDMNDHYKVLAKFNDTKRPQGPFKIGMRGNIKGVEWTIIGWIAYRTAEFPTEEWSEFFLYSPTHGYAWLVYENNKIYFSKRVRDFDLLAWQEKKPKTLFYHKGHYLQKEASYLTYIDYVEGELNWVAKFGDKFTTWDYNGVGFQVLNIEKTGEEIEVYHTERLDKGDIYSAFGLEYVEESKTTLQSDVKNIIYENDLRSTAYGKIFLLLFSIIIFTLISSFFYENTILETSFKTSYQKNITIKSNDFLTAIKISGYKNQQENLKILLYKKNKKIFEMNSFKTIFPNKEIKKSWSYNSKSAIAYIKLKKGTYHLIVKKSNVNNIVSIKITQKVIRLKYLFSLLVLFLIVMIYYYYGTKISFYFILALLAYSITINWGIEAMLIPTIIIAVIYSHINTVYNNNDLDEDDDWDYDDD